MFQVLWKFSSFFCKFSENINYVWQCPSIVYKRRNTLPTSVHPKTRKLRQSNVRKPHPRTISREPFLCRSFLSKYSKLTFSRSFLSKLPSHFTKIMKPFREKNQQQLWFGAFYQNKISCDIDFCWNIRKKIHARTY
jgi:hypothetical protein